MEGEHEHSHSQSGSGDDDDNVMMMMVMMKLRERPGGDSLVSVTSSGERTDPDYSILKIPEIFWWKISSFLTPPTGHFGFTVWMGWKSDFVKLGLSTY